MSKIILRVFVTIILAWMIIPIIVVIPMSFSGARFLAFPPPSWSLRWYESYFNNPAWMQATRVTIIVSVSSSVLATVIGTAAAYALNMAKSRLANFIQIVLVLPLIVPIVITAVGVFFVYAQVGLLGSLLGLVMANVMLGIPYVLTSVLVGLRKFDQTQEMVSRSLGMNRFRTFFIVTLPQIKASVISGMLFSIISSIDETVIALFISGGENQTLTKRMFTALRDEIDPTIASISTLMTAVSIVVALIAVFYGRRAARAKGEIA